MSEDYQPKVTVSWWNDIEEHLGAGITKKYEMDLDTDHFTYFAIMLRKFHEEPFKAAAEMVEGDTVVAVATPKPDNSYFESECNSCEEKIEKNRIHFEVQGETSMLYICKDCFFSLPY
jgi:hypothetical protein